MKAKVTTAFPGRRDNSGESETFPVGATIEGDLARVAVDNKWAEELDESGNTVETDDEKRQKAQEAYDAAKLAHEAAKAALDRADEAGKAEAQAKFDAADKKLKAASAKLEKLSKA